MLRKYADHHLSCSGVNRAFGLYRNGGFDVNIVTPQPGSDCSPRTRLASAKLDMNASGQSESLTDSR